MCLAIYKPADKSIPKKHLRNGFESNPHGAGFAYVDGGSVHVEKGFFSFKKFWHAFRAVQDKQAVVHFRFATHGKRDSDNCHPFPVTDNTVMIHNGVIDIPCDIDPDKSDTWHFVEKIARPVQKASRQAFFKTPAIHELLGQRVRGSKLVFLSARGEHVIINENAGHWHEGVWYSNDGYQGMSRWFRDDWSPGGYYVAGIDREEKARPSKWQRRKERRSSFVEGDVHNVSSLNPLSDRFPEIPWHDLSLVKAAVDAGYSDGEIQAIYDECGAESLSYELRGFDPLDREVAEWDEEGFEEGVPNPYPATR